MKKIDNREDSKKSLLSSIRLFESLVQQIDGKDALKVAQAMFTAWCLDQYIYGDLTKDIENAMERFMKEAPTPH